MLLGAVAVARCPEPGYGVDIRFDGNVTASAEGFEMDGTVAVPFVPHYVVIDSPDFWREPRAVVDYYRRVEGRNYDYNQEPARSRDELPPDGG